MGVSKAQKQKFLFVCQCGCGKIFIPFPVYKKGVKGLYYAKYAKGHHPNSTSIRTGKPSWNKGLTKDDHPSISKMGFQPGHKPYSDWSHVNHALKNDPELRAKWLKNKKGQVAWNKGLTKSQYPNGIASGPDHGNWCGNKRGPKDLAIMNDLKVIVLKRDNYTCQECGDRNFKGRGSRCRLEMHHIVAVAENVDLAFELDNLIILCHDCHVKTDNYGTKVIHKLRKQGGK